jgi:hypothetical protein
VRENFKDFLVAEGMDREKASACPIRVIRNKIAVKDTDVLPITQYHVVLQLAVRGAVVSANTRNRN